jgi:hypothetical protein
MRPNDGTLTHAIDAVVRHSKVRPVDDPVQLAHNHKNIYSMRPKIVWVFLGRLLAMKVDRGTAHSGRCSIFLVFAAHHDPECLGRQRPL